ncbi:MAG: hypothetical protein QXR81_07540 [Candidatus Nezhaarchaeales archaeon]
MVVVEVEWEIDRWNRIKFGQIVGVQLWNPPDRPEAKYPFVVYSYERFPCVKWLSVGSCGTVAGDAPEGTWLYMYNHIQKTRRFGSSRVAIAKVKEGAEYVWEGWWKAKNVEKVVDELELTAMAVKLGVEAARLGCKVSRSSLNENLAALYVLANNIAPIVAPPSPKEMEYMKIASAAENVEEGLLGWI